VSATPADCYSCNSDIEYWSCTDPDEAIEEYFQDIDSSEWTKTVTVYAADLIPEDDPEYQDSMYDDPVRRFKEGDLEVDFCAWIRANYGADLSADELEILEKLEKTEQCAT
jgi:hypothetical protein